MVCRVEGSRHRQDKAELGHMACTETGDWPTGLMTEHHIDDIFYSSEEDTNENCDSGLIRQRYLCTWEFASPCSSSQCLVCDPEVV